MVRLGLADPDRCRSWATSFTEANAGSPPSDAVAIAKFLISRNELTKFQAKVLLSDEFRKLRIGNYVQQSSEPPPPPFSNWLNVQHVGNQDSSVPAHGFLLRLKNDPTAVGILESLQQQSSVQSPHIQPFEVTISNQRPVLVFSSLAPGQSLHQFIDEKSMNQKESSLPKNEVVSLAVTLSGALAAFHEQGLIHGQVQADRVWLTANRQITLLRSLMTRPVTQGPFNSFAAASIVWLDGKDNSEYYLAPEAAQQQATLSSDVYSLGCLLLRLVTGQKPFDGTDIASIRAAHQNDVPQELVDSVAKGEAGDPLMRILAFALAKNPQARFQNATQMHRAFEAIAKSYELTNPTVVPSVAKAPAEKKPAAQVKPYPVVETPTPTAPQASKESVTPKQQPPAQIPTQTVTPEIRTAIPRVKPALGNPQPGNPQPAKTETPASKEVAATTTESQPEPISAPVPVSDPVPETTPVQASSAPPTPSVPVAPARRRRKKKSKAPLVLGGLGIGVLIMMISLLAGVGQKVEEPPSRPRPQLRVPTQTAAVPSPSQNSTETGAQTAANGFDLVDSERLLWVPPHASETTPPPIGLLPPGPGAIVSVRLKQVQDSSAGTTLLQAFSPELSGLVDQAAQRSKIAVDQISRCTIAMHPGRDGWPQVSLAIDLVEPQPLKTLIQRWGVSEAKTSDGETIYAGDEVGQDAFYVVPSEATAADPSNASIQRFAVGSLDQIQQVASIQGSTIPLTPILAGLWKSASETSTVTALFNPNFLFTDARQMFDAAAPQLRDPLQRMWIPTVGAVMIAVEVDGERVYLEARMAPSGNVAASTLTNSIRESIQELPTWSENFIVGAVPDPSWRLLANRLPTMLRFTVDQTRFGVDNDHAMLNTYLPAGGFAQLTIASLLAMNTPIANASTTAPPTTSETLTVEQMLQREMSISFDQESLEFAIAAVIAEFKRVLPSGNELPVVRIIGGDLQKMGITQNQQIRDFRKKEIALRTVLTDLTFAANPDKTATSSHDLKQSLIWVVADDPENPGKRAILVTTREAAAGKYELPAEFQPQ